MRRWLLTICCVAVLLCLGPSGVEAQNLLVNPDFDTDVTPGWSGLGVWDPMDAFGSPTSGSAMWINTFTGGGSYYLLQCVETPVFFEAFDLHGMTYVPSGQASTGESSFIVLFYADPGCSGFISAFSTPSHTAFDTWNPLTISGWSPPGFSSVEIGLVNTKGQPGDFQTFHDAVFFGPNPDAVFGDDFESGDLLGWSAVVGGVE